MHSKHFTHAFGRSAFAAAVCVGLGLAAQTAQAQTIIPYQSGGITANGVCANMEGERTDFGTPVIHWVCNNTPTERFSPSRDRIRIGDTTMCWSVDDGVHVNAWECDDTGYEKWSFPSMQLISKLGVCVDAPSERCIRSGWPWSDTYCTQIAGTYLRTGGCRPPQFWWEPTTGRIHSQSKPSLCLTVNNETAADGQLVILWPCATAAASQRALQSQAWFPLGGELRSYLDLSMCMDVRGASTAEGTPLQVWPCNGTDAQIWGFRGSAQHEGQCLDFDPSTYSQLRVSPCNSNSSTQMWTFWMP